MTFTSSIGTVTNLCKMDHCSIFSEGFHPSSDVVHGSSECVLANIRGCAGQYQRVCWPISECVLANIRGCAAQYQRVCWPISDGMLASIRGCTGQYQRVCWPISEGFLHPLSPPVNLRLIFLLNFSKS